MQTEESTSFDIETDSSCSNLICENTSEHLWKIANVISSSCPAVSRFYMCKYKRNLSEGADSLKTSAKREQLYCKYCGSLWSPGNYRVRILPCQSLNHHLKKLLKVEAERPWKLNNRQKSKLKKFKDSCNKIVYSCFTCKKKTKIPGDKKPNIHIRAIVSSSTPLSKIKLKKGDLNAGLFIPSPCSIGGNQLESSKNSIVSSERLDSDAPFKDKSTNHKGQNSVAPKTPKGDKTSVKNKSIDNPKLQITPIVKTWTSDSKYSSAQKKSNIKKRKTLLDQILKQEQSSKKKASLSSFLVSLG